MPTSADGRGGARGRPTPAQVISLGLVAAVCGAAVWLLDERPRVEQVELLPGSVLPAAELAVIEAALDRAQLADHRAEAGTVWVPRQRHAAYMRALVDADALPREFGSSLRRAIEDDSPWRSRAAQEERLRVAIQDELAHVIRSMPGIEQAAVLFDAGDRPSFPGASVQRAATASVNVRTRVDEPLEPSRVQAIRVLVAASIAGLEAERVAVTDLRSGRVHAGAIDLDRDVSAEAADPELARRAAHERHLATKIRQALSFVPGAVVDVTIAAGDEPAAGGDAGSAAGPALPRQQRVADANAPAEIDADDRVEREPTVAPVPVTGARITVTVAVPEPVLRAALGAGLGEGEAAAKADIDTDTAARDLLAAHIRHLLPPARRPADQRVIVTTYAVPAAGVAEPPASAGESRPHSLGRLVDDTIAAARAGRPEDVPRQAWLVLAAGVVAVVLWFVLRDVPVERARRRDRPRRRAASRIDWDGLEGTGGAGEPPASGVDIDLEGSTRGVAA